MKHKIYISTVYKRELEKAVGVEVRKHEDVSSNEPNKIPQIRTNVYSIPQRICKRHLSIRTTDHHRKKTM